MTIRHSAEEIAWVRALAGVRGVSVQRLYVSALRTGGHEAAARLDTLLAELRAAKRLLANAANNLNQVAVHLNAGVDGGPDVVETLRFLTQAVERVEAVAGRVGEQG